MVLEGKDQHEASGLVMYWKEGKVCGCVCLCVSKGEYMGVKKENRDR